jgi:Leucine-rich repeat (LRR) protein
MAAGVEKSVEFTASNIYEKIDVPWKTTSLSAISLKNVTIPTTWSLVVPFLTYLDLTNCIIAEGGLNFSRGFSSLKELGLMHMGLKCLREQVDFPPNITRLNLSGNDITDFCGVKWPERLVELSLYGNGITDASTLIFPPKLYYLCLCKNLITEVPKWDEDKDKYDGTAFMLCMQGNLVERPELRNTWALMLDLSNNRVNDLSLLQPPMALFLNDNPLTKFRVRSTGHREHDHTNSILVGECPLSPMSKKACKLFNSGGDGFIKMEIATILLATNLIQRIGCIAPIRRVPEELWRTLLCEFL